MLCPYCDNEMTPGFIQSQKPMVWKGKMASFPGSGDFAAGSIELSDTTFFKGAYVEAHLCRECRKLIIELENI